jgi:hypothetical protein
LAINLVQPADAAEGEDGTSALHKIEVWPRVQRKNNVHHSIIWRNPLCNFPESCHNSSNTYIFPVSTVKLDCYYYKAAVNGVNFHSLCFRPLLLNPFWGQISLKMALSLTAAIMLLKATVAKDIDRSYKERTHIIVH